MFDCDNNNKTEKTGTLTETEIELEGAIPIQDHKFGHAVKELGTLPKTQPLLMAIGSCHSLIRINDQLIGYSIDRKMLEATGWVNV